MFVFAVIAVLLVVAGAACFFYFVYTPPPAQPEQKASAVSGTVNIDGHERSYQKVGDNPARRGNIDDEAFVRKFIGYFRQGNNIDRRWYPRPLCTLGNFGIKLIEDGLEKYSKSRSWKA
jgi:hypothetical protein